MKKIQPPSLCLAVNPLSVGSLPFLFLNPQMLAVHGLSHNSLTAHCSLRVFKLWYH